MKNLINRRSRNYTPEEIDQMVKHIVMLLRIIKD